MSYGEKDKNIKCQHILDDGKPCGKIFIFSIKDQEFFAEKEFSDPKRCHDCRKIKKQQRKEQGF